jgi:4-amino-4-deoxy-L-arabinose transferase-like glycosyltransferase
MNGSRLWLALVLALFCLPLFVGLGRGDIRDDEAIYSFAVDRMLETGDWLEPKSIPNEDWAFVEKPPLKFWIVALPIRLGLLPHDEFGIRFWDVVFGGASFVYVFLIGTRLLNPVCGAVAVLILFVHWPLLFNHGLRSNNMEAPLLLCYCGAVYHFLEWAKQKRTASLHAVSVALYFVLGFMTKFVAALFLPVVLGLAGVLVAPYRRRLVQEWRVWAKAIALVLALVAPWFIWAHLKYGSFLWDMMIRDHVYTRFTAFLDPNHLRPWHFYFTSLRTEFSNSGSAMLVAAGLVVLTVQMVRRRWAEGFVLLLWFAVPVVAISAGTSKLYHYVYPFLPPLALAGGYVIALVLALAPIPIARVLEGRTIAWPARMQALLGRPAVRGTLLAVAAVAIGVAILSLTLGPVRLEIPGVGVVRSSGIFRPIIVATVLWFLAGATKGMTRTIVVVLVISLLPLPAYRRTLVAMTEAEHPMRTARDCLLQVQARVAGPGLFVDTPPETISHPLYYYLRHVRPWLRTESASPELLDRYLYNPAEWRPILVWEPIYQKFWHYPDSPGGRPARALSPSVVVFEDIGSNVFLLLPGPYAVCGAEARSRPAP